MTLAGATILLGVVKVDGGYGFDIRARSCSSSSPSADGGGKLVIALVDVGPVARVFWGCVLSPCPEDIVPLCHTNLNFSRIYLCLYRFDLYQMGVTW